MHAPSLGLCHTGCATRFCNADIETHDKWSGIQGIYATHDGCSVNQAFVIVWFVVTETTSSSDDTGLQYRSYRAEAVASLQRRPYSIFTRPSSMHLCSAVLTAISTAPSLQRPNSAIPTASLQRRPHSIFTAPSLQRPCSAVLTAPFNALPTT